jgi:hypothetical protein
MPATRSRNDRLSPATIARVLTIGVATVALLVAAIPSASAAPDYNVTFDKAKKSYSWSGGPGTSYVLVTAFPAVPPPIPCDTEGLHDCEDLLIRVRSISGVLLVSIGTSDSQAIDIDLNLYESNANGDVGAQLDTSGNIGPVEEVSASVEPGYYLARVDFALSIQGSYDGEASLTT